MGFEFHLKKAFNLILSLQLLAPPGIEILGKPSTQLIHFAGFISSANITNKHKYRIGIAIDDLEARSFDELLALQDDVMAASRN